MDILNARSSSEIISTNHLTISGTGCVVVAVVVVVGHNYRLNNSLNFTGVGGHVSTHAPLVRITVCPATA